MNRTEGNLGLWKSRRSVPESTEEIAACYDENQELVDAAITELQNAGPGGAGPKGDKGDPGNDGSDGAPGENAPLVGMNASDTPPVSPNAMDDEFDGVSLDPKWGFLNQQSSTATVANGQLLFNADLTLGNGWNLLVQDLPVGDWEFAAKLWMHGHLDNFASCGMVVLDSNTGHRYSFGEFYKISSSGNGEVEGGIEVQGWTDFSTWIGSDAVSIRMGVPGMRYYKITKSGGNLTFSWSVDGRNYADVFTEPLATHVAAPDKIGFDVWPIQSGKPFALVSEWFRRLA